MDQKKGKLGIRKKNYNKKKQDKQFERKMKEVGKRNQIKDT